MIGVVLYIGAFLVLLCLGGLLVRRMTRQNVVDKKTRFLTGEVFVLRGFPHHFYRFRAEQNSAEGLLQEKETAFSDTFSDCYNVHNLDDAGFDFYDPTISKWKGHVDFNEVVFQKGGHLS